MFWFFGGNRLPRSYLCFLVGRHERTRDVLGLETLYNPPSPSRVRTYAVVTVSTTLARESPLRR